MVHILKGVKKNKNYKFFKLDINSEKIFKILIKFKPKAMQPSCRNSR